MRVDGFTTGASGSSVSGLVPSINSSGRIVNKVTGCAPLSRLPPVTSGTTFACVAAVSNVWFCCTTRAAACAWVTSAWIARPARAVIVDRNASRAAAASTTATTRCASTAAAAAAKAVINLLIVAGNCVSHPASTTAPAAAPNVPVVCDCGRNVGSDRVCSSPRIIVNLRAATILGMIGAGGIGFELYSSMKLFQYQDTATCVLVILVMVMTADYLSSRLRARVLAG